MALVTNENADPNMQLNDQDARSPQKPAVCSPLSKAAFTPSTEAESPDSVPISEHEGEVCPNATPDGDASPELEAETPSKASAHLQIGECEEEAETMSSVLETLSTEEKSFKFKPSVGSWLCHNLQQEQKNVAVEFGKLQLAYGNNGKLHMAYKEIPKEEEVVQYLPKLDSKVFMAPPSWIDDALSAEARDAEFDLEAMRDFPKVHHPSWLFQTASYAVPRSPYLQRCPKFDLYESSDMNVTRAEAMAKLAKPSGEDESIEEDEMSRRLAALSRVAQQSYEDESDEEDDHSRAAFSKLDEQYENAATQNIARERTKAKWRSVLSRVCSDDVTLEMLCDGLTDIVPGEHIGPFATCNSTVCSI